MDRQLKIFDLSVIILIISNLITIYFTIREGWTLYIVLLIFWFQSVIIGIFTFIRILTIKKFNTNGLKVDGREVRYPNKTKFIIAFFFLFHYGFFHLIYGIFLLSMPLVSGILSKFGGITQDQPYVNSFYDSLIFFGLSVLIFFINHLISFLFNYKEDIKNEKNIGALMFLPYARIVPMHLFIIIGVFLINTKIGIIIFLLLKTIADIIMHQTEHRLLRK